MKRLSAALVIVPFHRSLCVNNEVPSSQHTNPHPHLVTCVGRELHPRQQQRSALCRDDATGCLTEAMRTPHRTPPQGHGHRTSDLGARPGHTDHAGRQRHLPGAGLPYTLNGHGTRASRRHHGTRDQRPHADAARETMREDRAAGRATGRARRHPLGYPAPDRPGRPVRSPVAWTRGLA